MNRPQIEAHLLRLGRPLVGSLAFDHRDAFNLRESCITMVEDVVSRVNPESILEVGTHHGHSACLWLCLSKARVTSVDIGHTWTAVEHGFSEWGQPGGTGLRHVKNTLSQDFPDRFVQIVGDSTAADTRALIEQKSPYDMAFIDGDHSYAYVLKDINMAVELGIKWIVLDDCTSEDEDTWRAAKDARLELVAHYVSIHNTANIGVALFRVPVSPS